DEHENDGQVYLVGEECLQVYLKQSNGKCPIQQHDHCEFVKNQTLRQQVSDLFVTCPRQYNLKKNQLKEEHENECNYKGNISEISRDYCEEDFCKINMIKIYNPLFNFNQFLYYVFAQ
ncbi:hypothetical protein RFI_38208, partial [Reticulomyxa filosa]